MRKILLLLVCVTMLISLAGCLNLSENANEKVNEANARILATGINTYNILNPDTQIGESDLNPETLQEKLSAEDLWPEDFLEGDDLQPLIALIYFKDGKACVEGVE